MSTGTMQIKGAVLKARLALIEQMAPGKGLPAVLGRLQPEEASTLQYAAGDPAGTRSIWAGGSTPRSWTSWAAASPSSSSASARPPPSRTCAGSTSSSWSEGDPQEFLSRAPMIYAFYYDQGRRDYEPTGPREAVLTTHGAEVFSVPDCATVVGWHRRALEMCGARNPRVVEEECRARGGARLPLPPELGLEPALPR